MNGKKHNFIERFLLVFGGNFLTSITFKKQSKYLLFLSFLFILYISNTYRVENIYRKINDEKIKLVKVKYNSVKVKSELLDSIRPSRIIGKYEKEGFGFYSNDIYIIEN